MKVLIVHAHEEPKSFNGAMRDTAISVLKEPGHTVEVSDLYAMTFNPVGGKHDFTALADPEFFKYGVEQTKATEGMKNLGVSLGFLRLVLHQLALFGPVSGCRRRRVATAPTAPRANETESTRFGFSFLPLSCPAGFFPSPVARCPPGVIRLVWEP
jgi:hypothetical protein